MRNIYEATELQSAALANAVEQLAKGRGWGARTISGMLMDVPEGTGRILMVYGSSLLLPYGRAVSFTPAPRPRVDGDTWMVDIRRSDGVSRPAWNQGITIKRKNGKNSEYGLFHGSEPIDDKLLEHMLEQIARP